MRRLPLALSPQRGTAMLPLGNGAAIEGQRARRRMRAKRVDPEVVELTARTIDMSQLLVTCDNAATLVPVVQLVPVIPVQTGTSSTS